MTTTRDDDLMLDAKERVCLSLVLDARDDDNLVVREVADSWKDSLSISVGTLSL
jgi:hypothetical protein